MAFMGIQKFIGDVPIFSIIETNLAENFGLSLPFVDPVVKYLTGVAELVAAALLVFGKRFLGGGLSVAIIGGAVLAHLTVLGIHTPMSGEAGAPESPILFFMALGSLAVAAVVFLSSRIQD